MPILTKEDGNIKLGGGVSSKLIQKLRSAPNPKDIFENMEDFNQEVEDSHKGFIIHSEEEDAAEKLKTEEDEKARRGIKEKPKEVKKAPVRNLTPSKTVVYKKEEPVVAQEVVQKTKPVERKEKKMDLEKELEEFDRKVEKTEQAPDTALGVLLKHPDAPSEKQIALWKKEHGEDALHITIFSAKDIYVYTHLSRAMWKKVQERMQTVQSQKDTVSEEELQEIVVKYCVKWPVLTLEWQHNSKGGILSALYNAIMLQSYFLTPQQVMAITTDL